MYAAHGLELLYLYDEFTGPLSPLIGDPSNDTATRCETVTGVP